jgi:hypothetical protein
MKSLFFNLKMRPMPTIKMIDGIKICIHYAEHSIKIEIGTLSTLKMDGNFPSKKQKIVLKWLSSEGTQAKATEIFYTLNPQLKDISDDKEN